MSVGMFALLAPAASAAGPGVWTEAQGPNAVFPSSEIAAARGLDSSLFVAFTDSPNTDLAVAKLGTSGAHQSTTPAIDDSSTRPAIVIDPRDGTVRALSGGFRNPGGSGIWAATAPAAGAPWSAPSKVSDLSPAYTVAAVDSDGILYTGTAVGSSAMELHRGTDPATTDHVYDSSGGQQGGLALDGVSQAPTLAWTAGVAGGAIELRARSGSATTGAPTGTVLKAPGLAGGPADVLVDQGVPISGRTGLGGVYTAYADADGDAGELLLWRVGDALPREVGASNSTINKVALAPAPDGSLWIAWVDNDSSPAKVAARQLRPDGTTLGPITRFDVPDPGGFLSIGQLVAVAQADRLDLLLKAGDKIYHSQVLSVPAGGGGGGGGGGGPALTPTILGRVIQPGGAPIAGALVEACPQPLGSCLLSETGSDGRYRIDVSHSGPYTLRALPPRGTFLTEAAGPTVIASSGPVAAPDIVMRGWARRAAGVTVGSGYEVNGVPAFAPGEVIRLAYPVPRWVDDVRVKVIIGSDDPEIADDIPDAIGDWRQYISNDQLNTVYYEVIGLRRLPDGSLEVPYTGEFTHLDPEADKPPHVPQRCPIGTVGRYPDCTPERVKSCPDGYELHAGEYGPSCWPEGEDPNKPVPRWGINWVKHTAAIPGGKWIMTCPEFFQEKRGFGLTRVSAEVRGPFNIFCTQSVQDPSGYVRSTKGVPIPGAKVDLLRGNLLAGPFSSVANGSPRMGPLNRRNPDRTDAYGHFGWDTVSGFYKVRASKAGCRNPKLRRRRYNESPVRQVPPPVVDLDIRLRCPDAPKAKRRPAVRGRAKAGHKLRCRAGKWKPKPKRYRYAWLRNRAVVPGATKRTLKLKRRDRRAKIVCLVRAENRYGRRMARSRSVRVR
ncbi:MAG TPA: carboxypeptidase-like regulatory domain-containing protein [Solirubrobacteraceae bacterium]|nr:carboxypeptidase-like regulatory domain-containing protein [Solirubrobacteraceae bacterium]